MENFQRHPSLCLPQYHSYLRQLLTIGIAGEIWALLIFFLSIWSGTPGDSFSPKNVFFEPRMIYSWYASLHAFYILLGVGLAHFLASLGWLRVTAFIAALPGPGFLFGLVQIVFAIRIFRSLKQAYWADFFSWRLNARI